MFNINIGGVPEHFNYPWQKCIENKLFEKVGISAKWVDFPGGTGAMAEGLDKNEIDLAVMLTEGSIKEIESGRPFKIIQKYVDTPLLWGIHRNPSSSLNPITAIDQKTIAISRYNSGSHLMSYVLAENEDWDLNSLKFKVCGNLDGAIKAINNNKADVFLWERYTTKPYVDRGLLKHIGDCPTPWPCFVIVAKKDFINAHDTKIRNLLKVLNQQTIKIKKQEDLPEILAKRYHLNLKDTKDWLSQTEWSQEAIKPEMIRLLKTKLKKFNILN